MDKKELKQYRSLVSEIKELEEQLEFRKNYKKQSKRIKFGFSLYLSIHRNRGNKFIKIF